MPAPKGNKNAVGNNGGRPPIWDNPSDLQAAIDQYFTDSKKITITGLALHLGFESRRSLHDYSEKVEFSTIIKKAITRVEMAYEEKLSESSPAGPIFALKNMGWADKTQLEHSTDPEHPVIFQIDDRFLKDS